MSGIDMLLFAVITVSAYTDIKYRKIYNLLLFPALVAALLFWLWSDGLAGLLAWGQGLILGLFLLLIPYMLGGIGAGDVKLLGVIGAFQGPVFVFYCFIATALVGGLMSVYVLLQQKKLAEAVLNIGSVVLMGFGNVKTALTPEDESTSLPYGLAIACGAMITYLVI